MVLVVTVSDDPPPPNFAGPVYRGAVRNESGAVVTYGGWDLVHLLSKHIGMVIASLKQAPETPPVQVPRCERCRGYHDDNFDCETMRFREYPGGKP